MAFLPKPGEQTQGSDADDFSDDDYDDRFRIGRR